MSRALLLAAALIGLAIPSTAQARLDRFAVVIGNNTGDEHEAQLRYAEADAGRVHSVLRELGGFGPANTVLLRGEDAATITRTLVTVNARIRNAASEPDTQTMLVVYFSGHSDASSLHVGRGRIPLRELAELVHGSAATFRLLIVDACRSGALSTLKGGKVVEPFAIPEEPPLQGEGFAFLSASAADEDAQESDEVRGSFFTHALVSGLMGAADRDGDGDIVLDEVYRYAYDATLRATSRTFAGLQHPSYRYDFRGQGNLVLTRPRAFAAVRGSLRFKDGLTFLVMRDHADGPVVAEISTRAQQRTLSVSPGRYFVRGRAPTFVLEGRVEARAGTVTDVDGTDLRRIEHARLVRKGGAGGPHRSQGVEVGARLRSSLPNAEGACLGPLVGYGIEWQRLGLHARLGGCRDGYTNTHLRATTSSVDLDVRATHAWDLPFVSLDLGIGGGGALFRQTFVASAPQTPRTSFVPFLEVTVGISTELGRGFYAAAGVAGETHFFTLERGPTGASDDAVAFAVSTSLALGRLF